MTATEKLFEQLSNCGQAQLTHAEIQSVKSEHAALVAVAKAAEQYRAAQLDKATNYARLGDLREVLDKAFANLATVRGESEGGK